MKRCRGGGTWIAMLMLVVLPTLTSGQESKAVEREYPFSAVAVKAALQQLGAYRGARLPALEGFIKMERAEIPRYERPYYEFKIELTPVATNQTRVRAKANVSAWYADQQGKDSGYQAFESNGRLETDLLDRLNDFLASNGSVLAVDVHSLEKQIAAVRQQRADAEHHVAQLEKQVRELQVFKDQASSKEYSWVPKAGAAILSAPRNVAAILLRAEPEDEFEVLESRGTWLRVGLENANSGWIRSSQVRSRVSPSTTAETPESAPDFATIREIVSPFTGEWARLKGKRVLYLWARPEGSILNVAAGKKRRFAQYVFMERYRRASHSSQNPVEGIVVIFLDQRGGVAAASLKDIGRWVEGSLSRVAFLKKCSFDPPGAFEDSQISGKTTP